MVWQRVAVIGAVEPAFQARKQEGWVRLEVSREKA
jgi:hypothetical protein